MKEQITLNQLKEHIMKEALKLHEASLMEDDNTVIVLKEENTGEGFNTLDEEEEAKEESKQLEERLASLREEYKNLTGKAYNSGK